MLTASRLDLMLACMQGDMMGDAVKAYNWSDAAKEAGAGMTYSAPLVMFRKDMARSLVRMTMALTS